MMGWFFGGWGRTHLGLFKDTRYYCLQTIYRIIPKCTSCERDVDSDKKLNAIIQLKE